MIAALLASLTMTYSYNGCTFTTLRADANASSPDLASVLYRTCDDDSIALYVNDYTLETNR